jgi:hypothetical protein
MVRLTITFLLIFFISQFSTSRAQNNNYLVKIIFDEWMDTTGFSNPNNFTWTNGLITIAVSLVDTALAVLTVSEPEINMWYTLKVSNVFDRAGNLINPDKDTMGCILKYSLLPVELSSFNAKVINEKVQLKWITQTEVHNFGFEIQRSSNEEEWKRIGFVEGYGNSNSPKSYLFADDNIFGGSRFKYRLKQIDTDGSYEYSEIIEVELLPDKYALFQNYPNPFNPSTRIRYQLPVDSRVEISIFSITGEMVRELINENKQAGTYEVEFNSSDSHSGSVRNLASGVYLYRIIARSAKSNASPAFIETKKMVIIK